MVAWDVEERHVEPADQIFEVVEGQVAAAHNEVRLDGAQPVAIETFVDFVGDGEYAQCSRYTRLKRSAVQISSTDTNATGL